MRFLFVIFLAIVFMGCQNRPCREIQHQKDVQKVQTQNKKGESMTKSTVSQAGTLKVRIYKPDGSLQCEMGKKVSLETMEKELKGITVYGKSNRNDGLMRIQVCGAPTGNANVYEINRSDLEKALKKGFKEWTFD